MVQLGLNVQNNLEFQFFFLKIFNIFKYKSLSVDLSEAFDLDLMNGISAP